MLIRPWTFLPVALAGWLHRHEQAALDYLREENRVLRELLGKHRLSFTDAQRRRLAARGALKSYRDSSPRSPSSPGNPVGSVRWTSDGKTGNCRHWK